MKITRLSVFLALAIAAAAPAAHGFTQLPVMAENGMAVISQHSASDAEINS